MMGLSRSEQMSRIRGRNTRPERRLRAALWAAGVRFRLDQRTPVGRPDLVFKGRRVAVFVDGCQWHGCPEHYVSPRTNRERWGAKLRENVARDQRQTRELEATGWIVVRVWEHDVLERLDDSVRRVLAALAGDREGEWDWRVSAVEALDESGSLERRHETRLRQPDVRRLVERERTTRKARAPRS